MNAKPLNILSPSSSSTKTISEHPVQNPISDGPEQVVSEQSSENNKNVQTHIAPQIHQDSDQQKSSQKPLSTHALENNTTNESAPKSQKSSSYQSQHMTNHQSLPNHALSRLEVFKTGLFNEAKALVEEGFTSTDVLVYNGKWDRFRKTVNLIIEDLREFSTKEAGMTNQKQLENLEAKVMVVAEDLKNQMDARFKFLVEKQDEFGSDLKAIMEILKKP